MDKQYNNDVWKIKILFMLRYLLMVSAVRAKVSPTSSVKHDY